MGGFPVAVLVGVGMSRLWLAFMASMSPEYLQLGECNSWTDLITGCGGLAGAVLSFTVGTIPGMPPLLNLAQVFMVNVMLFWAVRQFISGVG